MVLTRKEIKLLKKICNKETLKFIEDKEARIIAKKKWKTRKKVKKITSTRNNKLFEVATKFREDLIKKQTDSEKKFKIYLNQLGIDYKFQEIIYYENSFYIVDFFIPEKNIVFEIDGEYHKKQRNEDRVRTQKLKKEGVKSVFRFTNLAVNDSVLTKKRIKNILKI